MAATDDSDRANMAVLNNEMKHVRDDIAEIKQALKDIGGQIASLSNDKLDIAGMQNELKYLSTQIVQIGNDQLKRIRDLERDASAKGERWAAHKEEHARESANQKWFSSIFAAVLSTISTIVGYLVKSP